jgi:hypothetical protein
MNFLSYDFLVIGEKCIAALEIFIYEAVSFGKQMWR